MDFIMEELTGLKFGKKTHGLTKSSEYSTWRGMKDRCLNTNCKRYKDYGGRGITICQEWIDSFETFIKDMGFKPSKDHSIERDDNDLGYYPENCRWATKLEQANNQKNNVKVINIETNEIFKTIASAARSINIDKAMLYHKLKSSGYPNDTKLRLLTEEYIKH